MKKTMILLAFLVLLAVLLAVVVGCATTSTSVKESEKAELKILEAWIEPAPPKLEKEVYLRLRYGAPSGSALKACVRFEVLVPKHMAGPYSLEKAFEKELIGAGGISEIKIPLGKFHNTRGGSLPVLVEVYLKDKDGNRGPTKSFRLAIQS